MDVLTNEQRSYCMSKIRGKNTKPEIILRRLLWNAGYRYRIHYKIFGKPDVVFLKNKLAVFVDGCFWHGCPMHGVSPKTNKEFWAKKLKLNKERDIRNENSLEFLGWRVLRFWEHEIKNDLLSVYSRIVSELNVIGVEHE